MYHNVKIGEIVSYRIWTAFPGQPCLSSVFSQYVWKPQINIADLESYNLSVDRILKWPEEGGFYSFKTLLLAEMFFREQSHFAVPVLLGSMYNWGDVIEHKKGFHSTYAAIKSLDQIYVKNRRFFSMEPFEAINMYRKIYKTE